MTKKHTHKETPVETAGATETKEITAPAQTPSREQELETEIADLHDQLLRALAEVENIRRRAERDRGDAAKYAVTAFAKEMLSVADNLRRALEVTHKADRNTPNIIEDIAKGIEATERQLLAVFEKFGIRKLSVAGEKFDPHFHKAILEVENAEKQPGTVVDVLQDGYTIHDRLLREAMVTVVKSGK